MSYGKRPVPKGRFLCEIEVCQKTVAKSGAPRVSFHFEILAGKWKGRYLFDDAYTSDAGRWKLERIGRACNVEGPIDPDDAADLIEKFVGKRLFVTNSEDTYKGRQSNRVTAYHPLLTPEEGGAPPAAATG